MLCGMLISQRQHQQYKLVWLKFHNKAGTGGRQRPTMQALEDIHTFKSAHEVEMVTANWTQYYTKRDGLSNQVCTH